MSDCHPLWLVLFLVGELVSYLVVALHPLTYLLTLNNQGDPTLLALHLYRWLNSINLMHQGVLPHTSLHPTLCAAHLLVLTHPLVVDPILH